MSEPGYSLRADVLLWVLVAALLLFSAWHPAGIASYPKLVDWPTIATLAGLLLLTAGIEASGFLHRLAWRVTRLIQDERRLAQFLMALSAILAAVLTNDIALFIVVPLTLSLGELAALPVRRLVIFEALAVNTGSMVSPIGNPQNIFLWQTSGVHFFGFMAGMLPPTSIAAACLVGFSFLAFRPRALQLHALQGPLEVRWPLLGLSAACFVPFMVLADLRHAPLALLLTALLFAASFRTVFRRLDWPLLAVFILMFVDLRLVGGLAWIHELLTGLDLQRPATLYLTGAGLSQVISNVPTTILLAGYSGDWRSLAWGADVGGFGLAIGSLASLIALRLGRQPGSLRAFHLWSLPFFLLTLALTGVWLVVGGGR